MGFTVPADSIESWALVEFLAQANTGNRATNSPHLFSYHATAVDEVEWLE